MRECDWGWCGDRATVSVEAYPVTGKKRSWVLCGDHGKVAAGCWSKALDATVIVQPIRQPELTGVGS
jgi:hypothetical protein